MYVLLESCPFFVKEKRKNLNSATALLNNVGSFIC